MRKHSPVLLFGAGVVGIVGTVVLACRATMKLEGVLDEAQRKIDLAQEPSILTTEGDRKQDAAIVYTRMTLTIAKMYAPAVVVGVASIAALTGSHVVLSRRNVAITAAYAALDKGFRQYRERVVAELGEDKDREFRYAMEDRTVIDTEHGDTLKTIKQVGAKGADIYARFFDQTNPNWNRQHSYNQVFIQVQQNYANDLLNARGHVFLNEVYDMLGIPRSKEGAIVGWIKGGTGDNHVDFGVFEGDTYSGMRFVLGHEPSILLDFNVDGVIFDLI